jgi:transcriptional regulator with XRE-family HTH domain
MSGIGEKLIKLRTERNLSIKEVCQQAGIPPSRLVEIERDVRIPTPGQIERLENFYDVKSGELTALAAISENN